MAPKRKDKVTPEKTAKKVKRDKEGKTEEKNEEVEGDPENRAELAQYIYIYFFASLTRLKIMGLATTSG